jgi:hypothetical protein
MRVRSNEITHYTTRGGESKQALTVNGKNLSALTAVQFANLQGFGRTTAEEMLY